MATYSIGQELPDKIQINIKVTFAIVAILKGNIIIGESER